MTHSVSLLLGVHAHQPAGNFPEVLTKAHERCYRPFLQTLHRYPDFRFAAHFSGWLLQWLFDRHPQDMRLLREMVERGQAEIFGGGDFEPVLASIPERDRRGQIEALSARLAHLVGVRPRGAWLTERVWEATIVPALADCGIRYVAVDDYHFLCAGQPPEALGGYFTTEENGCALDLFPIAEALRYRIPFAPAEDAVKYIERLGASPPAAAIYFDDIEKFGIWPQTYEWVYERRWLEQFIEAVLASDMIHTFGFAEYRQLTPTRGVVYLPTTSYIEMNEWTLPPDRAHTYSNLVRQEKEHGRYDRDKAFVRGGIWKNFLSRYSEANWMHKRMLQLSARLNVLPTAAHTDVMHDLLYRAQANDAYWHGLFGGIYLPHLRRAVYQALVALERALDQLAPRPACTREDVDLDGAQEIFLVDRELQAVVRPGTDACVIELDAYALNHNFGDTLRRRTEHYYARMHLGEHAHFQGAGIASAHDRVTFKHAIAAADIEPDPRPRALFLERWRADGGVDLTPRYVESRTEGAGGRVEFEAICDGLVVRKALWVSESRLSVRFALRTMHPGRFETQLNLAMPSCDGFLGRYVFEGQVPGGFGQPLRLDAVTTLALEDGVLGGTLEVLCSPPASLDARPHFTVSQSEDGFEKVMQAVTLDLAWILSEGSGEIVVALEARRQAHAL